MELVKVSELFEVKYGVNLELVNLEECSPHEKDAMFFVSRTEKNNGVSAIVKRIEDVEPNPPHTISVAGGGSVLSSFYQAYPYYSGRDLFYLEPKNMMTNEEMLFFAYCLHLNKYKYNYGRQANKTLKEIVVPLKMPNDLLGVSDQMTFLVENNLRRVFINNV